MTQDSFERSPHLPTILTALLVLAFLAGASWIAYEHGVKQGRFDALPAAVAPTDNATHASVALRSSLTSDSPRVFAPVADHRGASNTMPAPQDFRGEAPEPLAAGAPVPSIEQTVAVPNASAAMPTSQSSAVAAQKMPVSVTANGARLQIGSFKSEVLAKTGWTTFKAKYSPLLAEVEPDIVRVDLGAKGAWYRLMLVVGDNPTAIALCKKLRASGAACDQVRH